MLLNFRNYFYFSNISRFSFTNEIFLYKNSFIIFIVMQFLYFNRMLKYKLFWEQTVLIHHFEIKIREYMIDYIPWLYNVIKSFKGTLMQIWKSPYMFVLI